MIVMKTHQGHHLYMHDQIISTTAWTANFGMITGKQDWRGLTDICDGSIACQSRARRVPCCEKRLGYSTHNLVYSATHNFSVQRKRNRPISDKKKKSTNQRREKKKYKLLKIMNLFTVDIEQQHGEDRSTERV